MAIDTSIYSNIKPTAPIEQPSLLDSMQKGMQLGQMGKEMQTQQAMKEAYAKNTGQDGQLNQQGFLSDLGKVNPQASMQYQKQFAEMGKQNADSQIAKMQATHQILSVTQPAMEYLAGMPEDKRAENYHAVMSQLSGQGIPTQNIPKDAQGNFLYDPKQFQQAYKIGHQTKEALDNQLLQAQIGKTNSETGEKQINRLSEAQKNLQGDELWKKNAGTIYSGKSALNMIDDASNGKNPGSKAMLPITFARFATGDQRINEMEADAFFKNQPIGDKSRQMWEGLKSGTLDPKIADSARQYIRTGMASAAQNKSDIEADHANKFAVANGLPFDVAHYKLTSTLPGTLAQIPAGPARFAKNQTQPSSGGPSLVSPASAADQPMIRMISPSGKIKMVSKDQYGEAIASGGRVAK